MFLADASFRAFLVGVTITDDPEMLNVPHTISEYLPVSEYSIIQF